MTEYKTNRCINKIETYFSFIYLKSRGNQSIIGLAAQSFIWDLATSTFIVALISPYFRTCIMVQQSCQYFSQQERGCDTGHRTQDSSLWALFQMSHPTLPLINHWTEFSMTIPSWLRNAKVISTAGKSYIKTRAEKDIKITSKIQFFNILTIVLFSFTLYISFACAIYFSRDFFIKKKIRWLYKNYI